MFVIIFNFRHWAVAVLVVKQSQPDCMQILRLTGSGSLNSKHLVAVLLMVILVAFLPMVLLVVVLFWFLWL